MKLSQLSRFTHSLVIVFRIILIFLIKILSMTIIMYTDGACHGNPGPGGWAVVVMEGDTKHSLYGAEKYTTNNRMELKAAIKGLQHFSVRQKINLHTDSQYLKNGITLWINKWQKNNWRTTSGEPVKNKDLWLELLDGIKLHEVNWYWVKGHANNKGNIEADVLATRAIELSRQ